MGVPNTAYKSDDFYKEYVALTNPQADLNGPVLSVPDMNAYNQFKAKKLEALAGENKFAQNTLSRTQGRADTLSNNPNLLASLQNGPDMGMLQADIKKNPNTSLIAPQRGTLLT